MQPSGSVPPCSLFAVCWCHERVINQHVTSVVLSDMPFSRTHHSEGSIQEGTCHFSQCLSQPATQHLSQGLSSYLPDMSRHLSLTIPILVPPAIKSYLFPSKAQLHFGPLPDYCPLLLTQWLISNYSVIFCPPPLQCIGTSQCKLSHTQIWCHYHLTSF